MHILYALTEIGGGKSTSIFKVTSWPFASSSFLGSWFSAARSLQRIDSLPRWPGFRHGAPARSPGRCSALWLRGFYSSLGAGLHARSGIRRLQRGPRIACFAVLPGQRLDSRSASRSGGSSRPRTESTSLKAALLVDFPCSALERDSPLHPPSGSGRRLMRIGTDRRAVVKLRARARCWTRASSSTAASES